MFDNFSIALLGLSIQAIIFFLLPSYKESTLRDRFGHTFMKVVCLTKDKDYPECLLRNQNVYSYIFHFKATKVIKPRKPI